MKKFLSSLIFFSALFILLYNPFVSFIFSKEEPFTYEGYSWICIPDENVKEYNGPRLSSQNQNLNTHRRQIIIEGLRRNTPIYIVGCVNTTSNCEENQNCIKTGGLKCTTGNDQLDNELKIGPYTELNNPNNPPPLPYYFVVENGAKKELPDGKLDVVIASYTPTATWHHFFLVTPVISEEMGGGASTVKYSAFEGQKVVEKCAMVHWDPKGRVFDAKTLEPIPNVVVYLLTHPKGEIVDKIRNPEITKEDGMFNFFVPSGWYKLAPTPPASYKIAKDINQIHPNYKLIYTNEAYKNITQADSPFFEPEGKLLEIDIPLESQTTSHSAKIIKEMENPTAILNKPYNKTRYLGRVSHPFTVINILGHTTNNLITKVRADKYGAWEVSIPNEKIPQNEPLVFEYIKEDLTRNDLEQIIKQPLGFNPKQFSQFSLLINKIFSKLLSIFSKSITAESLGKLSETNYSFTSIVKSKSSVDPIFPYLEGYAYDEKGNVIPNALVMVKLKMSNKVYYQTKADEKGFFQISKEYLPIFEYYLEFQPQNKTTTIRQSTAEFAKKNQDYLSKNKINLMTATKNNQPIIVTPSSKKSSSVSPTTNLFPQIKEETSTKKITPLPSSSQSSSINWVLLGIVILLILVTIVIFLVFFLRQKI